jgi:DNA-binding transcriptional ArsR family regulator
MDWANPLRSIAATVDADVLKVLAGTSEAVTGNQLARLAGRSYAQVYAVVRRMAGEGLVRSERYGRTTIYRLNHDHVLSHGIVRLLSAPGRVEGEIRQAVLGWDPPPDTVALVGSAARRRTLPGEDIELLVVRPDSIGGHHGAWRRQVDLLVDRLADVSGNPVALVEVDRGGLRAFAAASHGSGEGAGTNVRTVVGRRPHV